MTTAQIVHPAEVRKALRDARRFLHDVDEAMNRADIQAAYAAAERAQHAAFDAKSLLQSGGRYTPEAEQPVAHSYVHSDPSDCYSYAECHRKAYGS